MEDPVYQLKHPSDNAILAEINKNGVTFTTRGDSIQKTLKINGVNIPSIYRSNYNGRSVVPFHDPQFYDAFVKHYIPNSLKEFIYERKL